MFAKFDADTGREVLVNPRQVATVCPAAEHPQVVNYPVRTDIRLAGGPVLTVKQDAAEVVRRLEKAAGHDKYAGGNLAPFAAQGGAAGAN